MEEKERYEIHRYTLQGNEKISFNDYTEHICEHYDFGFEKIKPFNQRIQDLLNQQYAKIKEFIKENQQLKEQLSKKEETLKHIMSGEYIPANIAEKTLKLSEQSQKQLAIEELEKTLVLIQNAVNLESPEYDLVGLYDALVRRIKELKGEQKDE